MAYLFIYLKKAITKDETAIHNGCEISDHIYDGYCKQKQIDKTTSS